MSLVLPLPKTTAATSHSVLRRFAPLIIIQAFLWATVGLFAFGPWQWPMRTPDKLFGFLTGCNLAILVGYAMFAHVRPTQSKFADEPAKLIKLAIWTSILVIPITTYARTGKFVPDVIGSILNPGQAYMEAHNFAANNTNAGAYIRILLSPVLVMVFPLATFYWGRLHKRAKVGVVGISFATVLLSVCTGQRRDIADLLATLPLLLAASNFAGVTVLSKRVIRRLTVGVLVFLACFLVYFSYSHISRVGADTASYAANPATQQQPDRNNWLLRLVPDSAQPGFLAFTGYLTTGYYGLSLCLDREHEPMYGFGHSMFLTRNFSRFSHDDGFEQRSLPYIISEKDGFKYPVYWCTAYPYFLNDLGPIGTIALMFVFGALLAVTWSDVLGGRNPYAVVMFWMLAILAFYLPATNRMLQDGEGVFAFYIWLFVYLRARRPMALKGNL